MNVPVRGKLTIRNLREAVVLGFNVLLWIGLLSNYRRSFWRAARRALKRGQIDAALGMGLVAYHLIRFSRDALRGDQNASFYSTRSRALTPRRNTTQILIDYVVKWLYHSQAFVNRRRE